MPTYDYRCKSCGHEFELFQAMSAPVKRKCPACSRSALERLIGVGAGFIFKGSGFYETDYRSESYKKAAESDSKTAESAASSTSGASAAEGKSSGEPAAKATTEKTTDAPASAKSNASADKRSAPAVGKKSGQSKKKNRAD